MTVPRSLTGKYQLVILGADGSARVDECANRLISSVSHSFDHLGVNPKKFLKSFPSGSTDKTDGKMPVVAVFFGFDRAPKLSAIDADRMNTLLADGALLIPIVDDLTQFSAMVPTEITSLNGCTLEDCGAGFERLASRILEGFGLLREKRRLFISYRRTESSGVATQLYEALDAAGFDVFLDTQGTVKTGEPFQEVLWHRLADTDVTVLLDTPGFLASRWTEEELARANTSNIQLLQVLWPAQTEAAGAAFSTFHPLTDEDFAGADRLGPVAQLKDEIVKEIVDEVEGLRARAFGARHSFLVREFIIEARDAGMQVFKTLERNLVVATPGTDRVLIMPAIGIPDAEGYEALERLHQRDISEGKDYAHIPVLLYDQTGIRSRWIQHLGWLNDNISCARSISISEAKKWLDDLKAAHAV